MLYNLSATIDGRPVENLTDYRTTGYRFQSPMFDFKFPGDNILGVSCSDEWCNAQAASDGYWIMLAPLSKGKHTIRFAGSFVDPNDPSVLYFGLDVTYELTIE